MNKNPPRPLLGTVEWSKVEGYDVWEVLIGSGTVQMGRRDDGTAWLCCYEHDDYESEEAAILELENRLQAQMWVQELYAKKAK